MAWSHVRPTRLIGGERGYDFACTCGEQSDPEPTPAEADLQRQQHMNDNHDDRRRPR